MGGKKGEQVSTDVRQEMPSKKSTDRPRRYAKDVANVRIASHSDAATPPQPVKKDRKDCEKESPSEDTMAIDEEDFLPPRIVVEGQEPGEELEYDEEEIIVLRAGEEPDQRPPRMKRKKGPEEDVSQAAEDPSADDVAVEESDDEDEEETSSSEESEEEVQQMRRKRQRGKRGATATPAPSPALTAALDRLSVDRCPRGTLLCREAECAQIKEFIRAAIARNGISQACYISGVPGTGKTASVMAMVEELRAAKGCRPFFFLRANTSDPKHFFTQMLCDLKRTVYGNKSAVRFSNEDARRRVKNFFGHVDKEQQPLLLLVDDLTRLSNKNKILRDICKWTAVKAARVSIIIIANTLDLPEQMLSQEEISKLTMNRIVFQPYTHAEIERIELAKLGRYSGRHEGAIIDPEVVEIAARKVAAISGDLRKATDILRAAIEMAMRKGEQRVTPEQVKESQRLLVLAVRSLSRHQEMVFDAVVHIVRTRVSDFSVGEIVEKYNSVHEKTMSCEGLNRLLVELASLGLVHFIVSQKSFHNRRYRLLCSVLDAAYALKIVAQEKAATVDESKA